MKARRVRLTEPFQILCQSIYSLEREVPEKPIEDKRVFVGSIKSGEEIVDAEGLFLYLASKTRFARIDLALRQIYSNVF